MTDSPLTRLRLSAWRSLKARPGIISTCPVFACPSYCKAPAARAMKQLWKEPDSQTPRSFVPMKPKR